MVRPELGWISNCLDPNIVREFVKDRIMEKIMFTDKISDFIVKYGLYAIYNSNKREKSNHVLGLRQFIMRECMSDKTLNRSKFLNEILLITNTSNNVGKVFKFESDTTNFFCGRIFNETIDIFS